MRFQSMPRISLRTIFLLFLCVAIGMTCASAPAKPDDATLMLFNIRVPQLNWHYAVLSAASVAMVIGLIQQTMQLVRRTSAIHSTDVNDRFAIWFATAWRIAITATIGICLLLQLLLSREVIIAPENELFFTTEVMPNALWIVSLIVVLSDCVSRWRSPGTERRRSRVFLVVVGLVSVTLALVVLPDIAIIAWLVHIATAGIEHYAPGWLQRSGAFPNQYREGFRLFWLSVGSVTCVVIAGVMLMAIARATSLKHRLIGSLVSIVLCAASGSFCVWYFAVERHRISPDLSSVELASSWFDWIGGIAILLILVTAGAYRLSRSNRMLRIAEYDATERNDIALHESFGCLVLLGAASAMYFVEIIRSSLSASFLTPSFIEMIVWFVQDPMLLLYFAVGFLSLQLCWVRWRRRSDVVTWQLAALPRERFVWNWFSLAALAIVAVPTASIYSFVYWLGPWYLYR